MNKRSFDSTFVERIEPCVEHRTPDRKAWVRCLMPPNTLRVYTENVLVKSVGPKVLWAESRVQGTEEYFPPIQFHGKMVEIVGGRHLSSLRGISPSYIVLSPVWNSRPRPTTCVLLAPCQDEFHGPRSNYVRQVTLATTTERIDAS
ncbi:uncharacterized protein TNCV_4434411 [Trichonephila clavipes]|nr:uncharacterized protein TNCV_4434411 [Trichonephila clavipes]